MICTSLSSTVACDVLIAGSLLYYLNRSRTGFKRTDSIINNLMLYSLTTGLLTSIFAIVNLVTFLTMPGNMVNISVSLFLGKLYSNSLMTILNSRAETRAKFAGNDGTVHLTDLPSNGAAIFRHSGKETASLAVYMTHTREEKSEPRYPMMDHTVDAALRPP
ncbi:hypothetical protein BD410DRAFT_800977 [Rickenella mellea]|uniref:DUF6534 domain-containing protein n=1 Tax=Rickenella mellea TaxID=50990 RepID=A0A4Y7QE22_9AGAM|nr:hypothetical protein BD410DRAFT_800977 [Rickenella mellea]